MSLPTEQPDTAAEAQSCPAPAPGEEISPFDLERLDIVAVYCGR